MLPGLDGDIPECRRAHEGAKAHSDICEWRGREAPEEGTWDETACLPNKRRKQRQQTDELKVHTGLGTGRGV